jgi:hypothetical protein
MRVNVYAEEITQRVELVTKVINGQEFVGVRFYLELPVTQHMDDGRGYLQHRGPFIHTPGDDDSAAVTFWGKKDSSFAFAKALDMLDQFSAERRAGYGPAEAAKLTNENQK